MPGSGWPLQALAQLRFHCGFHGQVAEPLFCLLPWAFLPCKSRPSPGQYRLQRHSLKTKVDEQHGHLVQLAVHFFSAAWPLDKEVWDVAAERSMGLENGR